MTTRWKFVFDLRPHLIEDSSKTYLSFPLETETTRSNGGTFRNAKRSIPSNPTKLEIHQETFFTRATSFIASNERNEANVYRPRPVISHPVDRRGIHSDNDQPFRLNFIIGWPLYQIKASVFLVGGRWRGMKRMDDHRIPLFEESHRVARFFVLPNLTATATWQVHRSYRFSIM